MRRVGLPQLFAELSGRARLRACTRTLVVTLSVLACPCVLAVSMVEACTTRCVGSKLDETRAEAAMLVSLAEQHLVRGRLTCDDVAMALSSLPLRYEYDPWGVPYAVHCFDGAVVACSAGKDRQRRTHDDICSNDR